MVSTFTPNIQLEEPARGDQVGTWDTPVNTNMTLVDKVVGAITTIGLNNSNVVLSSPQYQSKTIVFNSTLTGSVIITFPTSFTKTYEIQNLCTGTSAFTITLQTTAAGGKAIGTPQGDSFEIVNTGSDLRYHNFGRTGTFWDYAGSSVPNWISVCTVAPFLNCDGTTFSAATFPALAVILGSTTLPDSRGSHRATLNQGTGRITTAGGGIDGNTNLSRGGSQSHTNTATEAAILAYTSSVSVTAQQILSATISGVNAGTGSINQTWIGSNTADLSRQASYAIGSNAGGNAYAIMNPTYIAGITLIRSA